MKKMVNALTGCEMLVDESRVKEYQAAGHKLAAKPTPKRQTRQVKKKTEK
jgi:hypothetical protein